MKFLQAFKVFLQSFWSCVVVFVIIVASSFPLFIAFCCFQLLAFAFGFAFYFELFSLLHKKPSETFEASQTYLCKAAFGFLDDRDSRPILRWFSFETVSAIMVSAVSSTHLSPWAWLLLDLLLSSRTDRRSLPFVIHPGNDDPSFIYSQHVALVRLREARTDMSNDNDAGRRKMLMKIV